MCVDVWKMLFKSAQKTLGRKLFAEPKSEPLILGNLGRTLLQYFNSKVYCRCIVPKLMGFGSIIVRGY